MSSHMFSDYELTTQINNVTLLVEGILVGPQPHYERPPTVPSDFGRLVDPIGRQQPDLVPVSDTHVTTGPLQVRGGTSNAYSASMECGGTSCFHKHCHRSSP